MNNLAYNDEIRTELLNGKLVSMAPRPAINHNIVSGNIYRIFGEYLDGKPCIAFSDGVDVYLTENDRVIPDMMIVCNRDIIKKAGIYGTPDFIVEVLSPSTAKNDKGYKKELYEKAGVKEYWIVSIDERSIEVYLLKDGKYKLDNIYIVYPDYLLVKMTEEEKKKQVITEFQTSLYDDLTISLNKIFKGIF